MYIMVIIVIIIIIIIIIMAQVAISARTSGPMGGRTIQQWPAAGACSLEPPALCGRRVARPLLGSQADITNAINGLDLPHLASAQVQNTASPVAARPLGERAIPGHPVARGPEERLS